MFVEKLKIIRNAEDMAADRRNNAQAKAKALLAEVEKDGQAALERAELAAAEQISSAVKKSKADADRIVEKATGDSKLNAVAQKVEAEGNMTEAVKIIIERLFKEWQ